MLLSKLSIRSFTEESRLLQDDRRIKDGIDKPDQKRRSNENEEVAAVK